MEKLVKIDGRVIKYTIIRVNGDGACLFKMLSLAMFGTEEHSILVRRDIVKHVVENYELYKPSVVFEHLGVSDSPNAQQYNDYMSLPDTYGDFLEVTAASALYQRRLIVVREGHIDCDLGCRDWSTIVTEFTGSIRSGHYDLCWPSEVEFHSHPLPYRSPPSRPPLASLNEDVQDPLQWCDQHSLEP